jgi:hypothetical protein
MFCQVYGEDYDPDSFTCASLLMYSGWALGDLEVEKLVLQQGKDGNMAGVYNTHNREAWRKGGPLSGSSLMQTGVLSALRTYYYPGQNGVQCTSSSGTF